MIYYEEPNAIIYQGHALDILRGMPSESVDCVITSPPYWGLRTYKTEPIIWGDNNCEHEWGDSILGDTRREDFKDWEHRAEAGLSLPKAPHIKISQGNFCLKCHAWKGQLGLEPTIELYISHLLQVFDQVKRMLKAAGTLWVNMGDSYASSWGSCRPNKIGNPSRTERFDKTSNSVPEKSLCLIPERFALEMVERGWILRNNIIWVKPNPMPESCKDRFTGTYEYLYFFTKSPKYWFEQQFEPHITEPGPLRDRRNEDYGGAFLSPLGAGLRTGYGELGRNKRDVWEINTQPYPEAHFAVFPEKLVETPILAGCPRDGIVMDIFTGSGTTGAVAKRLRRKYIGIELSGEYCKLHKKRLQAVPLAMELI